MNQREFYALCPFPSLGVAVIRKPWSQNRERHAFGASTVSRLAISSRASYKDHAIPEGSIYKSDFYGLCINSCDGTWNLTVSNLDTVGNWFGIMGLSLAAHLCDNHHVLCETLVLSKRQTALGNSKYHARNVK